MYDSARGSTQERPDQAWEAMEGTSPVVQIVTYLGQMGMEHVVFSPKVRINSVLVPLQCTLSVKTPDAHPSACG